MGSGPKVSVLVWLLEGTVHLFSSLKVQYLFGFLKVQYLFDSLKVQCLFGFLKVQYLFGSLKVQYLFGWFPGKCDDSADALHHLAL